MENVIKNIMSSLMLLSVAAAIAVVVWLIFFQEKPAEPESLDLTPPPSDMVTTQSLMNGNLLVSNATARFEAIVPAAWYLEKRFGGGTTFYPDYDATKKKAPTCKIEISVLQNPEKMDLDDWLTNYLHADPTAEVVETLRVASSISGHSAITWTGSLNGNSTTLAYISRDDSSLYEIAPSVMQSQGISDILPSTSGEEHCLASFRYLLSSFRILS